MVDFTYVQTWAWFVYMAFVIDTYARRIVGWKGSPSATAGFVMDAMEQTIHARRPGPDDGLTQSQRQGRAIPGHECTQRLAEANYYAAIDTLIWSHDSIETASGNPGRFTLTVRP